MTQPQAKYGVIFVGRHVRWIKVKKEKEICMIGKYLFIEGGVSGRHTECKALAERGDEVHILTVLKMSSGYPTLTCIPSTSVRGLQIIRGLCLFL